MVSRSFPPLYVLRHGETEWNAEGRLQGAFDSPLTATGRAQGARQGAILKAVGVRAATHDFLTSPQGRARATATLALAPLGAEARADPALAEIGIGDFAGRLRADLRAEFPEVFSGDHHLDWYFRVPGGETFADVRARAAALLARLDRPTVLVTHGITSRFIRGVALGLEGRALLDLPGGQGVVHLIEDGRARVLDGSGPAG
ncbi:histidine phosphatase family protein [Roseovarius salinarum]|uniref:histidine phosphatase family protein n=1 Tax=Roseovarius salinarum TaxID=1981892 RepID=UPI000C32EAA4|nr:histidine phosphatase family protein [Roseovarius salinarum]